MEQTLAALAAASRPDPALEAHGAVRRGSAPQLSAAEAEEIDRFGEALLTEIPSERIWAAGESLIDGGMLLFPRLRELRHHEPLIALPRRGGGHPYRLWVVAACSYGIASGYHCCASWSPNSLRLLQRDGGGLAAAICQLNAKAEEKLSGSVYVPPFELRDAECVHVDPFAAAGRLAELAAENGHAARRERP